MPPATTRSSRSPSDWCGRKRRQSPCSVTSKDTGSTNPSSRPDMTAAEGPVTVAVKRVRAAADPLPLPTYQTAGAAGMDLAADVLEPLWIAPGARALVPTGLAVAI